VGIGLLLVLLIALAWHAFFGRAAAVRGMSQPGLPIAADFSLLDQDGKHHQLRRNAGDRAVVLFVHGVGCPIVRQSVPALNALQAIYRVEPSDFLAATRRQFPEPGLGLLDRAKQRFGYEVDRYLTRRWLTDRHERGVSFLMLNASPQDDRANLRVEANDLGIKMPILKDDTQLVARGLGISRTAQALLIDTRSWQVVYRGPIDDRLDFEAAKPVATRQPLRDAIDALLAGRTPAQQADFETPGCAITLPDGPRRDISYSQEVAPLLLEKCAACHRRGGIGPWAMDSYETVKGWSAMVREVVSTRRMPPWHADPDIGHFANDRSLSTEQIRILADWAEAGAPRGEGPDPLLERVSEDDEGWPLGKPDIVIEAPTQDIPAQGVLDYRYADVPLPIDRDIWVRAVHLKPSDASVVHHEFAFLKFPAGHEAAEPDVQMGINGFFAAFAPGLVPQQFPDGSGQFVPKGTVIQFQQHYTPTGRATQDRSRLAIYLLDAPPARELRVASAHNTRFRIPALEPAYPSKAHIRFNEDVVLHALFPHMHLRGRSARYEARLPNAKVQPLLSVPRYRFGWQTLYFLREPLPLPASTEVTLNVTYDNSPLNPSNPDPERAVYWGEQTTDEMLIGYLLYTVPRPATETVQAHGQRP
jgi:hypothetical protein